MTMRTFTGFLMATLVLGGAACSKVNTSRFPVYGGVPFHAKVKAVDKKATLADFQVTVAQAARSPKGAYEAAEHTATSYCIEKYGTSLFEWSNLSTDAEGAPILTYDRDRAVFLGTCAT